MSQSVLDELKQWVNRIAALLEDNQEPEPHSYAHFLHAPEHVLHLITLLQEMEDDGDKHPSFYSACVFAVELCVAQLQAASEVGNKSPAKVLQQLMHTITVAINTAKHPLGFWLPILNAFYDVHVELSPELQDAYLNLAIEEDELSPEEEKEHLESIRDLIAELADLTTFDIAENFFAQSYAMPPEFFSDLLLDLYSIPEGHDIALLALLHPKAEVREVVVATFDALMPRIKLSSISLSRLQAIKYWYPVQYHSQFEHWIKLQRKKGVVFTPFAHDVRSISSDSLAKIVTMKASEVDGSGAQGVFLHIRHHRQNRLCGLLLKHGVGIKDAWITPVISARDINRYYGEAFDDSVMLRSVDLDYIVFMANHFLALTIAAGGMPDLHLLEMQEELGVQFLPRQLDLDELMADLAVQISPFTPEALEISLKRSRSWPNNKRFTESWYVETPQVDKIVNRYSTFVEGVKACDLAAAMQAVFEQEMEVHREWWCFHFIWIALWLKAQARKTEKMWQDSFMIAYAIHTGRSLITIPIMHEICRQTVINSIETMQERKTHLYQE